ncbi:MAG: BrnA antitoxin family protein [Candidatus Competibacteraceae bacterium]
MKNEDITLNERAKNELAALKDRPIDLTDPDAPEVTDWSTAQRGKFYRPIKQQITVQLDKDVLEWFMKQPGQYQTLINEACREYMHQHDKSM